MSDEGLQALRQKVERYHGLLVQVKDMLAPRPPPTAPAAGPGGFEGALRYWQLLLMCAGVERAKLSVVAGAWVRWRVLRTWAPGEGHRLRREGEQDLRRQELCLKDLRSREVAVRREWAGRRRLAPPQDLDSLDQEYMSKLRELEGAVGEGEGVMAMAVGRLELELRRLAAVALVTTALTKALMHRKFLKIADQWKEVVGESDYHGQIKFHPPSFLQPCPMLPPCLCRGEGEAVGRVLRAILNSCPSA
jgi:hypothetical protein